MSDSRQRILERIRAANEREHVPTPAEAEAARRTAVGDGAPQRPEWQGDDRERFQACLEAAAGTWTSVATMAEVGGAVAAYIAERPAGGTIHRAPDPALDGIHWPDHLTVATATDGRDALVGVSRALAGVAETGSLALASGPDNPATLAFLPDYHVVVLGASTIVPWLEDLWARMRGAQGFPPRSFNLITGPSRTADVEQTLQLGAHGPRSLHVVIVEDA